jgi:hypothetical protein
MMLRHTLRLAGLALGAGVLSLALGSPTVVSAQQPTATTSLVFDNVTVVDVQQGRLLPAQRVVIVGNRIRTMGSVGTVSLPAGAKVVDAKGKYLIPGLWDMHTHSRRYTDFFYPLFIANGVTGMRDGWSEVPLDTLLLWRREIVAGTRVGPPRQFLAGPALDEASPCTRDNSGHVCVADAADARHVVDSLKAAGASYIKTYELGRAMYFVVAAEARRVGIPFGGHLTAASAMEASDSGASILDHIQTAGGMDTLCLGGPPSSIERCQAVANQFRNHNTWWVPTLSRRWLGANREFPPQPDPATKAILMRWHQFTSAFWNGTPLSLHRDWLRDSVSGTQSPSTVQTNTSADTDGLLRIAHRAGLPILAGTDGGAPVMTVEPPGFALHLELTMYVSEGLTPLEALQAATINPAKLLHGTDSLGTVAPGKLADLVLLDADPLQNITNTTLIRAVVANGRYFDRAALDQLLADVQAKAKQEPQPLGTAR